MKSIILLLSICSLTLSGELDKNLSSSVAEINSLAGTWQTNSELSTSLFLKRCHINVDSMFQKFALEYRTAHKNDTVQTDDKVLREIFNASNLNLNMDIEITLYANGKSLTQFSDGSSRDKGVYHVKNDSLYICQTKDTLTFKVLDKSTIVLSLPTNIIFPEDYFIEYNLPDVFEFIFIKK